MCDHDSEIEDEPVDNNEQSHWLYTTDPRLYEDEERCVTTDVACTVEDALADALFDTLEGLKVRGFKKEEVVHFIMWELDVANLWEKVGLGTCPRCGANVVQYIVNVPKEQRHICADLVEKANGA